MASDGEYLFMSLLAICIPPWKNCLFAYFKTDLFVIIEL